MSTPTQGNAISDVERLARDLAEAVEQQSATSQVLDAIGQASSELGPLFEMVVHHAVRLCRADSGMIWQRGGDVYRLACALGGRSEYRAMLASKTIACASGTTAADEIGIVGLVGLERRTVTIDDARTDPRYEWPEALEVGGQRSMLGVPILVRGEVLGVIVLNRHSVAPFDERTVNLVTTFATQGAIAIQNVRLLAELEQRGVQLAQSVDELRALGEISQAVSSSLDVVEVLTTIVHRAVELSEADGGSIFEYDAESHLFQVRAMYGTDQELIDKIRQRRVSLEATFVGRAVSSGEPQQAADLNDEPRDPHIDELRDAGWRSLLVVPLLREDEIIGALAVRRKVPGRFAAEIADLLETLANQSAVAIQNARLYRQLEWKTQQLEVASEELADWNRQLERRVADQLTELERLARLKRFLPPQLVDLVVTSGDESFLESHRREITVVFCDLRGFTAFAETVEPEDVMNVLGEFHRALGRLVHQFEGTLDAYSGDGMMIFFNDPIPCTDGPARATRMAVAMRESVAQLIEGWSRMGHNLHFGVGVAQGHATLGQIGYEGRFDYTAIGSVTNLAARLCAEAAPGQILISQRVRTGAEGVITAEHIGDLSLKGFSRPMPAYNVIGVAARQLQ
jgi:class 3 adenylate cyclase